MIPVEAQPEPADFSRKVRDHGLRFLRTNPNPTSKQFKSHSEWQNCLPDLRKAYRKICAYSSCFIPANDSVDHFIPKSVSPKDAYEWTNFRLCFDRVNQKKGNSIGILDPFALDEGWFYLDLASFYIRANTFISGSATVAIQDTIRILGLNEDWLVELRYTTVMHYLDGNVTLLYLEECYPFIAAELKRQNRTQSV